LAVGNWQLATDKDAGCFHDFVVGLCSPHVQLPGKQLSAKAQAIFMVLIRVIFIFCGASPDRRGEVHIQSSWRRSL
jgi:hypothetical protein